MNILIPHHWLLEQLETEASPFEIQKHLSLSGPSVERIYEKNAPVTAKGTEHVYDIEVTTNRVDSMSVRGIAREAAVILSHANVKSKLKSASPTKYSKKEVELPLPKIHDPENLCKRVMCVVLQNVERTETPNWMAERLQLTDQNIHDSVIDITNYITHELGHPVHAFDYDKVMAKGGVINVVTAKKGIEFVTLDNQTYTTVGGEIVFENNEGEIIDLPAIKGTANTSIDKSTKNVLLWIENLPAKRVRFTSMTHSIRTTAAQLSEKNVDPHLAESVLLRGIELYVELCSATVASEIYDHFPAKKESKTLKVPARTFTRYLGIELSTKVIIDILESLECEVEYNKDSDSYTIRPPSFRPDLTIQADFVEEIARIYGYHNLPSTLMDGAIPTNKQVDIDFAFENKIKHFLANVGAQEVYCYSTVSDIIAKQSGYDLESHLKLQNPLSEDRVYLRRSLLPSIQEVLDNNPQRKQVTAFEIANIYIPRHKDIPEEHLHLGIVSTKSYREVRGMLEALLRQFYVSDVSDVTIAELPESFGIQKQMGSIIVKGTETTTIGTIAVLKSGSIGITISVKALLGTIAKHPTYHKPPTTAQIIEDLTFTIPTQTAVGDILHSIKAQTTYVTSVELGDIYKQNYTFTLTYHDPETNITTERVEPIRKEIINRLAKEYEATLVGSV